MSELWINNKKTNWLEKLQNCSKEIWTQSYNWLQKASRTRLIFLIAVLEIEILIFIYTRKSVMDINNCIEFCQGLLKNPGLWTFITLLVSSPIAFAIWHFRDANTQQQIENQRKDVNLKEFQKIAEWVSGAHLAEEKITDKPKDTQAETEQETAHKYNRQPEKPNIATFSKQDSAVGLQIAAIHMLLPFYRGDHGEDFRLPAFNLLTAAWLSLFSKVDDIETGRELAKQPLAVAITEVLFAEGGLVYSTEEKYEHLLVNLRLPFVNLNLLGLGKEAANVFAGRNCQGIDLHGATLRKTYLVGADLTGAHLEKADLTRARLIRVDLTNAYLGTACLERADLTEACLEQTNLDNTNFVFADCLVKANLTETRLNGARLNRTQLLGVDLTTTDLTGAHLFGALLKVDDCKTLLLNTTKEKIANMDLIVLVRNETGCLQNYQLTATKKDNEMSVKVEHIIKKPFIPNIKETRKRNENDWEVEIEKLSL